MNNVLSFAEAAAKRKPPPVFKEKVTFQEILTSYDLGAYVDKPWSFLLANICKANKHLLETLMRAAGAPARLKLTAHPATDIHGRRLPLMVFIPGFQHVEFGGVNVIQPRFIVRPDFELMHTGPGLYNDPLDLTLVELENELSIAGLLVWLDTV